MPALGRPAYAGTSFGITYAEAKECREGNDQSAPAPADPPRCAYLPTLQVLALTTDRSQLCARMRADYSFLRTRCALGTRFEHDVERRLCRTPEARKSTALDQNLAETALARLSAQGGALPRQRYRYAD